MIVKFTDAQKGVIDKLQGWDKVKIRFDRKGLDTLVGFDGAMQYLDDWAEHPVVGDAQELVRQLGVAYDGADLIDSKYSSLQRNYFSSHPKFTDRKPDDWISTGHYITLTERLVNHIFHEGLETLSWDRRGSITVDDYCQSDRVVYHCLEMERDFNALRKGIETLTSPNNKYALEVLDGCANSFHSDTAGPYSRSVQAIVNGWVHGDVRIANQKLSFGDRLADGTCLDVDIILNNSGASCKVYEWVDLASVYEEFKGQMTRPCISFGPSVHEGTATYEFNADNVLSAVFYANNIQFPPGN